MITAGWQEREAEDDELRDAVGSPCVNLRLHGRAEEVFSAHPELFASHRQRQDRLRQQQHLYRRRLRHAMDALRELQPLIAHPPLGMSSERLQQEVCAALDVVCDLDRRHAAMAADICRAHAQTFDLRDFPELARHRQEVRKLVEECQIVAVAGGHVASLLNRMQLLELAPLLWGRHILCWSAGAMVLCEEIVLFHDCPPQGHGDAEVLGDGLGLLPGVLALPHASRRLVLDDRVRVDRFARRFAPRRCVALDPGSEIVFTQESGQRWQLQQVAGKVLRKGGICN